jgi:hypothetical protein
MFNSKFSEKLYRAWMGFDGAEEVRDLLWAKRSFFFLTANSGKKRIIDFVFPLFSYIQSRTWNRRREKWAESRSSC